MEKLTKEQVDEAFNGLAAATGQLNATRDAHNRISLWLQIIHRLRDEHFPASPTVLPKPE